MGTTCLDCLNVEGADQLMKLSETANAAYFYKQPSTPEEEIAKEAKKVCGPEALGENGE